MIETWVKQIHGEKDYNNWLGQWLWLNWHCRRLEHSWTGFNLDPEQIESMAYTDGYRHRKDGRNNKDIETKSRFTECQTDNLRPLRTFFAHPMKANLFWYGKEKKISLTWEAFAFWSLCHHQLQFFIIEEYTLQLQRKAINGPVNNFIKARQL